MSPVLPRLFDFRSRRRYGKCPLECFEVPARQIGYRDVCEIRVAPASNIIPGDCLLGHGLASSQRREANGMRRMLVDDRCHRTVADNIDAATEQGEALRGEVRHPR